MLKANAPMIDIDVDHWRNLQGLLLEPASGRPRIILIHENGELLKFVHSEGADATCNVERIDDPREAAKKVYDANSGSVDFVAVFERGAIDRYFAQVQDSWNADESVDGYVHRMYALLNEYPEGIVTHPDPAGTTLGLQWRLGASYEEVGSAVSSFVPPESSVVFGIFDGDDLWASLILGFDAGGQVALVTTADPSDLDLGGGREAVARGLVGWVNKKHSTCSLGLFVGRDDAGTFLGEEDKAAVLRDLSGKGRLIADPVPEPLAGLLGAS